MKALIVAATGLALHVTPVHAQIRDIGDKRTGGRIGPPPSGVKAGDRVNEKDYNAAVNRIPTDTQKADPWRTVRDKQQAK